MSFEDSINFDGDGNELHLEDVLGTDGDIVEKEYEDVVDKQILAGVIDKLPSRDREILTLRYGLNNSEEYTQKELVNLIFQE